jgi:hypothetical protein
MTNAMNTGIYGRVNPGPGFGDEYSYTDDAVLTAAQDGASINNAGAAKAIEITLPAAVAGMELSVTRIANFDVTVSPSGSETIQSGAPGASFKINNRGTMVLSSRADGSWEIIIEPLASAIGVVNLRSFGDNGAALYAACVSLQDYETLLIPAESYDLSDHTTGFPITANNCHVTSLGTPVLNFGGYTGILLTGGDQNDVTVSNIHFKNFVGTGVGLPNDGSQQNYIKNNIVVRDCKFTDCSSSSSTNIIAVRLDCMGKQIKVLDNHFESIVSTGASAAVYGALVGLKCNDITRDPNPSAAPNPPNEYDYAYDGADILTAEGSNIVRGNTFRKLSTAYTGGAVLVDGWRCHVSGNVFEYINYSGASTAPVEGNGVFIRGFEHSVTGNHFIDCRGYHILTKDSSASATFGTFGHNLITGNTFRSQQLNSTAIIGMTNGYARITNNYFVRCSVESTTTKAIVWVENELDEVTVDDNTFERCTARHMVYGRGSGFSCRRNRVMFPQGPYTTGSQWECFMYANATTTYGVTIEDNEIRLDPSALTYPLTSSSKFCISIAPVAKIGGLIVRNNRLIGTATGTPTGTWGLVRAAVTVDTQDHWIIEGNWTDAVWRGLNTYTDVTLNGATVWPQRMSRATRFPGWIKAQAGGTLAADETGGVFVNEGATGTWGFTLPAAVPGLEFGFVKTVAHAMTVTPNGSEVINAGSGGGALTLTNVGSSAYLKCFVAGLWIAAPGDYTVA